MKDTTSAGDCGTVEPKYLSGSVANEIDPMSAGSSAGKDRSFSGDTSRASTFGAAPVITTEVLPATRTTDLPAFPGYPQPYNTYESGN